MIRSLAFFVCLTWASSTQAQLPVKQAASKSHSGFLYYDSENASDRTERVYRYTIAPPQANCLQLSFNLQSSGSAEDFIRIFPGKKATGPEVFSLGGKSGGKIVQYEGAEVTVEFRRDAKAMGSAWTLFWHSDQKGDCIDEETSLPECPELKEICGPVFRQGIPAPPLPKHNIPVADSSCASEREHRFWYKFMVQQEGQLGFQIHARNRDEDLDWALWRADSGATAICPSALQTRQLMACNRVAGRGAKGQTGMGPKGIRPFNAGGQNPWSSPLQVQAGQVFFLLVQPPRNSTEPFEIAFNETVLQCEAPPREVFPIAQVSRISQPVTNLRMFTRSSKTLRIDLHEKVNHALRDAVLELPLLNPIAPPKPGQNQEPQPLVDGLPGLLLWGLQTGRFQAFPASVSNFPIHYGDILDMVYANFGEHPTHYWAADQGLLAPMCEVIDLQVEEVSEWQSGRVSQRIHTIRLVWFDPNDNTPGFNVALFPFAQIRPFLDAIEVAHPRNEAATLSLGDLLDQQLYHSFALTQRNRRLPNLAEAQRQKQRRQEFESYKWSH